LPVGPENPSDSASLMACRSMARLAARRTRRSAQGEPAVHCSGNSTQRTPLVRVAASVSPGVVPALERGRPRRLVGNAADHETLHVRRLAPVAVEGLEDQLDARLKAHELVRTGADGRLAEAVVAELLDVLLGHDPGRAGGAGAIEGHEIGPRLLQHEAHAAGVHHLHLAYTLAEEAGGAALVALERELHVLGRHRFTIVESHALAEHEVPDAPVPGHRERLGQGWRVQVTWHRLHQRVMQRVQDHERRDLGLGLRGVEPAGGERDVHAPRHRAGRLRGRARGQQDAHRDEQDEPAQRASASTHDTLLRLQTPGDECAELITPCRPRR